MSDKPSLPSVLLRIGDLCQKHDVIITMRQEDSTLTFMVEGRKNHKRLVRKYWTKEPETHNRFVAELKLEKLLMDAIDKVNEP